MKKFLTFVILLSCLLTLSGQDITFSNVMVTPTNTAASFTVHLEDPLSSPDDWFDFDIFEWYGRDMISGSQIPVAIADIDFKAGTESVDSIVVDSFPLFYDNKWFDGIFVFEYDGPLQQGFINVSMYTDEDGDGFHDNFDNCPLTSNSNQADSDGDGIGDVCEFDVQANIEANKKLRINNGSLYIDDHTQGIILKDLNGSCYKLGVDTLGNLETTLLNNCPDN